MFLELILFYKENNLIGASQIVFLPHFAFVAADLFVKIKAFNKLLFNPFFASSDAPLIL